MGPGNCQVDLLLMGPGTCQVDLLLLTSFLVSTVC